MSSHFFLIHWRCCLEQPQHALRRWRSPSSDWHQHTRLSRGNGTVGSRSRLMLHKMVRFLNLLLHNSMIRLDSATSSDRVDALATPRANSKGYTMPRSEITFRITKYGFLLIAELPITHIRFVLPQQGCEELRSHRPHFAACIAVAADCEKCQPR